MQYEGVVMCATFQRMAKIAVKHPNNLRKLRENAGLSQQAIADVWGVERGDVSRIEHGKHAITTEKRNLLLKHFGWSVSELYPSDTVKIPICGYVGAGEIVYSYDDHAKGGGLDEVEVPPGMPSSMVAVIIRGDSMEPAFEEGWIIFYQRTQEGVPPDCIGETCVVKLEDDGMLLKKVKQGSKPSHYHLISKNPLHAPMVDQKLQWAARVLYIKTK